jgi:lactaldehyde dehydrogenase/glycolaldehyde dehydrogenase
MPPGVINMVSGPGDVVGSALVESPITRLVSMTGSIRAGQNIYRTAAENITALILELGGKAPFIVMDDAEMDKAVEAAVVARFANCGQVCICNEMVMVHEKVADEFAEKVAKRVQKIRLGNPMTEVDMGPSVTARGLDRVDGIVKKNIEEGAELLTGGKRPEGKMFEKGNWYEPTVLYPVKNEHESVKNEIFGPVMPIVKVSGFEEAIELSNARREGLSAYLFTNDYRKFMRAIDLLEVGTIFINRGIVGYIQGYHNGHKMSGIGGEDGSYGIEGYLQKKTIYLNY